ncbi:TetR/AcrR family transcriptional regulator [Stutzerimonas zhaodongensis]|uniref:TetR/AcrR family transcriptional regulator n=1 Tax=Stutzerimonas zhaodongensis TaxID=1176257 RepID=A0A3M2HJU2_9GAMM|nr:TetR/AcrR family transcriptional regulator [Stutzerimonas zhaodongensis]MCQ4317837.1 TetR/AcrR family transcriptional regulator [Stutzerimonas zhaodongensis]RMH87649.1 TetR/AcrR family transcriptional regulator [Stutzerimonas zhaodongensis]
MKTNFPDEKTQARQKQILVAARWCFLNYGFAKTTFDDIAKRAALSRTLIYRVFKSKEDVFQAVFVDWLLARQPAAKEAAEGSGSPSERLLAVCRVLALEPWAEMAGTLKGGEYHEICKRVAPDSEERYRKFTHECVCEVLGDASVAEVFLLALNGLFADEPEPDVLERRIILLVSHFSRPTI